MDSGMVVVKMSSDLEAQAQQLCFKALSFSGKRDRTRNDQHAYQTPSYKECQKNHAAAFGGHALDGCGEYMPPPPPSLKCAACGCHRNFHRSEAPSAAAGVETRTRTVAAAPIYSHRARRFSSTSPSSSSSPSRSEAPISSIYPSAPQILMALSSGFEMTSTHATIAPDPMNLCFDEDGKMGKPRKRFRTKFSAEQKEKMRRFAEGFGWKMQRSDEDVVKKFCDEIGVCRNVLKVWMHNNKSRNSMGINTNNNFDYNGGGLSGGGVESEDMHVAGNNGGKQSTNGSSASLV